MKPIELLIIAFSIVRLLIGLAPFVAAGPLVKIMGFPAEHNTPTARLMARLFGVRDIGLGLLSLYTLNNLEMLKVCVLFNVFVDAGDIVSIITPLVRREGLDRAALTCGTLALFGGSCWMIIWTQL